MPNCQIGYLISLVLSAAAFSYAVYRISERIREWWRTNRRLRPPQENDWAAAQLVLVFSAIVLSGLLFLPEGTTDGSCPQLWIRSMYHIR